MNERLRRWFSVGVELIAVAYLAACNVVTEARPTITVYPGGVTTQPTAAEVTQTVIYTATREPTATSALTGTLTPEPTIRPTPKLTPTETLEPLVLNTNPERIEAYTRITMEDITSGRVATANRALAKPFPPEAFIGKLTLLTNTMENDGEAYIDIETSREYRVNPNARPTRWIAFNVMGIDGKDWIFGSLQVLNKDGGFGILNALVGPKDYYLEEREQGSDSWKHLLGMFRDNNANVSIAWKYVDDCSKVWTYSQTACKFYKGGRQSELVQQWAETGNVPEELERLPVRETNTSW